MIFTKKILIDLGINPDNCSFRHYDDGEYLCRNINDLFGLKNKDKIVLFSSQELSKGWIHQIINLGQDLTVQNENSDIENVELIIFPVNNKKKHIFTIKYTDLNVFVKIYEKNIRLTRRLSTFINFIIYTIDTSPKSKFKTILATEELFHLNETDSFYLIYQGHWFNSGFIFRSLRGNEKLFFLEDYLD